MVDLIDPYKISREGPDKPLILKSLNMIDLKIGWFKIVQYNDKYSATIANIVEQNLDEFPIFYLGPVII